MNRSHFRSALAALGLSYAAVAVAADTPSPLAAAFPDLAPDLARGQAAPGGVLAPLLQSRPAARADSGRATPNPASAQAAAAADMPPFAALDPPTRVNVDPAGNQISEGYAVASDADGDYVVVWTDGENNQLCQRSRAEPENMTRVLAQRYNRGGERVGNPIQVSTVAGDYTGATVGMDAVGNFAVAFSRCNVGEGTHFDNNTSKLRFFSANGRPQGPLHDLDSSPGAFETWPQVSMAPDGATLVTWTDVKRETRNPNPAARKVLGSIIVQRFGPGGVSPGSPFRVDVAGATESAVLSASASSPSGEFVIAWLLDLLNDPDDIFDNETQVFAQRYSSAGARIGGNFRVDQPYDLFLFPIAPAVTMNSSGAFAIGWQTLGFRDEVFKAEGLLRRYDGVGSPGGQRRVETRSGETESVRPALTLSDDNRLTAAYTGLNEGAVALLLVQSDAADLVVGGPEPVTGEQATFASIARDADGDLRLAWSQVDLDDRGMLGPDKVDAFSRRYRGASEIDLGIPFFSFAVTPDGDALNGTFTVRLRNLESRQSPTGFLPYDRAVLAASGVGGGFQLSPGVSFVSAGGNGWTCSGGQVVFCDLDRVIEPRRNAPDLTLSFRATQSGTVTFNLFADQIDPEFANNMESFTVTVP